MRKDAKEVPVTVGWERRWESDTERRHNMRKRQVNENIITKRKMTEQDWVSDNEEVRANGMLKNRREKGIKGEARKQHNKLVNTEKQKATTTETGN